MTWRRIHAAATFTTPALSGLRLAEQGTQHVLHDAAVPVVLRLARRVDPDHGPELLAVGADGYLARSISCVHRLDASDVEHLVTGEPERCRALPRPELQRQHTHPDQVGPVDPLERLHEHRPDAKQRGPLRGPVARRSRAVLLAAEHD